MYRSTAIVVPSASSSEISGSGGCWKLFLRVFVVSRGQFMQSQGWSITDFAHHTPQSPHWWLGVPYLTQHIVNALHDRGHFSVLRGHLERNSTVSGLLGR